MTHDARPPFSIVASDEELRKLYRTPSDVVKAKVQPRLDPASIAFIARSPFALVGSHDARGHLDVSPRGGPPGFASVVRQGDTDFVVLPDLNGNNLLDTFTNVVTTGYIGMLFLVPGKGESVRINGRAWVTADADLMTRCTPAEFATPKAALLVEPSQVFIHCAKAFRRSGLWEPTTWSAGAEAPDGVDILAAQGVVPAEHQDSIRSSLLAGYETELAADKVNPATR